MTVAAHQAIYWAFAGPILWLLDDVFSKKGLLDEVGPVRVNVGWGKISLRDRVE